MADGPLSRSTCLFAIPRTALTVRKAETSASANAPSISTFTRWRSCHPQKPRSQTKNAVVHQNLPRPTTPVPDPTSRGHWQPHANRIAPIVRIMTRNPERQFEKYPTKAAADAWYDLIMKQVYEHGDANNALYYYDASSDYKPAPALGRIANSLIHGGARGFEE